MLRQALPAVVIIIFFFLALFIYVRLAGPIPFSVNSIVTTKSDTFNVTGEGKISVSPDIAIVNAGVSANGTTVKQAQDQINLVVNKVSEAVKKLGVSDADIQTSNYSINPNYDFTAGSQRIIGYSANTNLIVKVKNLDNVNQIIDAATANGANQVGGVTFDVEDKSKAEDEARKKAMEDARKKAEQAAKTAGFTLGRLVNYQETSATPTPPFMGGRALEVAPDNKATQVEPGSTEITVNVTLSYEIR